MAKRNKKPSAHSSNISFADGNPVYASQEDIYSQAKRDLFDGENMKTGRDKKAAAGESLDIPGAELDDAEVMIGEEDEENNYYSLGGDAHNDLEEGGSEPDH